MKPFFPIYILLGFGLLFIACGPEVSEDQAILAALPDKVDYNYHIKPLLSDRCYACHGPDENKREAGLRLDLESGALAELTESPGKYAIKSGSLSRSQVYHRIQSEDPDFQMPPPESNLHLDDYEIALINKWIDQGAEFKKHWSFIPPQSPRIPKVKQTDWVRNPIDHFVLDKLNQKGLGPATEADKERLLRRLSLDLTGLAPTIKEMDDFLADESPEAYEKVVDRLLATDAYAERLTMEWMDVARYADSHGMHADGWRSMWPWRDWVIKAFKENLPYNQFIQWQLAGDMMPDASQDQILATAFHRNHPMTAEGGAIDEEYRIKYVIDRANTTATAFLGLTVECAQCHDHKFDPISQKEFYQFSAFFNNVKELGMTGDDGNYGPILRLPDDSTATALKKLDSEIAELEQQQQLTLEEIKAKEDFIKTAQSKAPNLNKDLVAHYPLEKIRKGKDEKGNAVEYADRGKFGKVSGELEKKEGKLGKAFRFDSEYDMIHIHNVKNFEHSDAFSAGLWINTEQQGEVQTLLCTAGEKNNFWRGWELYLDTLNRPAVRLIHSLPHDYIEIKSPKSLETNAWQHLMFSYDGSGKADGLRLYLDGKRLESYIDFDRLARSMKTVRVSDHVIDDRPIRVARSYRLYTGEYGIFKGKLDDIRIYGRALSPLEVFKLVHPADDLEAEASAFLDHYVRHYSKQYQEQERQLKTLRDDRIELMEDVVEVMVMEEMPQSRPTHILNRGNYDEPMEEVSPATPEAVLTFPEGLPQNRLGLSQWITDPKNPLTARVTVNRYWQMIFGKGLVQSPQDFGNQGRLPTHPELLDWLALDFVASDWDLKHLIKTIVMSATYRQTSKASPEALETDPLNEWLSRGPKARLSAEMIRDNALFASGLLHRQVGGPSVKPYQPPGLWIDKGNFSHKLLTYQPDSGQALYRRSLYTFVKRTSPHPAMAAFDAPDRSVCTVQRENTNTPLQALVLLNDPQFVEAARVLAERMQKEGGEELALQLQYAFRLCTGRKAAEQELEIFVQQVQEEISHFQKNPEKAKELLSIGEYPYDAQLPQDYTAALTVVASTMLNHDEAYTKR